MAVIDEYDSIHLMRSEKGRFLEPPFLFGTVAIYTSLVAKKSDKVDAQEVEVKVAEEVDQNEALLHYKATGVNEGYVDPLRDQEPDIAPEKGVAPEPMLFNPPPPQAVLDSPFVESKKSEDQRARPLAEKEEAADDFSEAEVTPQDIAGGDEEGNIPEEEESLGADVVKVAVVADHRDESDKSE